MATLVRWQPWTELATLQTDMSRLMNGLLEGNGKSVQSWVPALDVWETENEIVYAFDLPGIPEDEISVEVEDGSLTVQRRAGADERADGATASTASSAGTEPSRGRSACRRACPRTGSPPTTRTASSRSTPRSPSRRSRAGSRWDPRRRRRSRARRARSSARPSSVRFEGRPRPPLVLLHGRQAQREHRAAAGRVRRLDAAAVRLDDVTHDREAEARIPASRAPPASGRSARRRAAGRPRRCRGRGRARRRRRGRPPRRRFRPPGSTSARCRARSRPRGRAAPDRRAPCTARRVEVEADAGRVPAHALDLDAHDLVEPDVLEPRRGLAVERELDQIGDEAVELVDLVDDRARDGVLLVLAHACRVRAAPRSRGCSSAGCGTRATRRRRAAAAP